MIEIKIALSYLSLAMRRQTNADAAKNISAAMDVLEIALGRPPEGEFRVKETRMAANVFAERMDRIVRAFNEPRPSEETSVGA